MNGIQVHKLRKRLYPKEQDALSAQITVTGAESYIGSAVIERLLIAGHVVHATWRGRDPNTVKHLLSIPHASTNLKLFVADLMVPGAFQAALIGSKFLVHIASPCDMNVPKDQGYERLIKPALAGVENVLTTALSISSLEKVVLTSSVAAVAGSKTKMPPGHRYSEADWNSVATETYLPYNRSKTLAEQRAYDISADPNCHWTLATICPAIVQGPPAAPIGMPFVDIDDVAAAHSLALAIPEATGRFVVCSNSMLLPDYVDLLRPRFSGFKLPRWWLPYWILWLVLYFRIVDKGIDLDLMARIYKNPPQFDNQKSRSVLGLDYIDIRTTAQDMAESIINLGFLYD